MSPLRRLEKRLEKMEETKGVDSQKFFSELVEIVRMNQGVVDELAKANDALRVELSRLPGKLDELISNLDELISFIKAAGANGEPSATGGAGLDPLLKKMDEIVEGNKKIVESNEALSGAIDQISTKLKRPAPAIMPGMRRLPPLKRTF